MSDVNLEAEARHLEERSALLLAQGATAGTQDPEHVARYLAASERVDGMSVDEVVDVLKQAVDREVPLAETDSLRRAARSVLLSVLVP
jgi:hypothetical protein